MSKAKEQTIYEKTLDYLDKQMDRISKRRKPDGVDIKILLATMEFKKSADEGIEKEMLTDAFKSKYFKKILDGNKNKSKPKGTLQ